MGRDAITLHDHDGNQIIKLVEGPYLKVGSCCCLSLRQRRGLLSWGLCAVSLPPFPLPLKPGNGGLLPRLHVTRERQPRKVLNERPTHQPRSSSWKGSVWLVGQKEHEAPTLWRQRWAESVLTERWNRHASKYLYYDGLYRCFFILQTYST